MRLLPLAVTAAAALALAGCGDDDPPPVPLSCIGDREPVVRALAAAPGRVTLAGGITISECLRRATSPADLQEVGITLTNAGEDLELLALRGDAEAALQLGYLAGAAREGAKTTSGLGEELVWRLEASAGAAASSEIAPVVAAVNRGTKAGAARG
ncbi:MAG TPA: hypothetical protein VN238_06200 [Solirubrobacteraceae bacterium]|nr:hypothetical protein [Solirubrobacteraceae bacterium]